MTTAVVAVIRPQPVDIRNCVSAMIIALKQLQLQQTKYGDTDFSHTTKSSLT